MEERGRIAPHSREASEALLDSDEGVKRAKIMVGAAVVQKMIGVPCFNAIVNEIGCEDKPRGLFVFYTSKITG